MKCRRGSVAEHLICNHAWRFLQLIEDIE